MTNVLPPLIAVINDDSAFIQLMCDLLDEEGYRTICGYEGGSAHALLKQAMPDAVVLDIRLEQPDAGYKVLEMLRLDPITTHIPVLICSADATYIQANEQRLRDQNCDIIMKPFQLDELLGKLSALLASR